MVPSNIRIELLGILPLLCALGCKGLKKPVNFCNTQMIFIWPSSLYFVTDIKSNKCIVPFVCKLNISYIHTMQCICSNITLAVPGRPCFGSSDVVCFAFLSISLLASVLPVSFLFFLFLRTCLIHARMPDWVGLLYMDTLSCIHGVSNLAGIVG